METLQLVLDRLHRIESALASLVDKQTTKEWYSTGEIAKLLSRAEFTVRQWCRLGRVNCEKKRTGRGRYQAWVISHEELLRIEREGLLPLHEVSF